MSVLGGRMPGSVPLRLGRVSARVSPRTVLVVGLTALVTGVVAVLALAVGDFPLSPGEVVAALLGDDPVGSLLRGQGGNDTIFAGDGDDRLIGERRLPNQRTTLAMTA